MIPRHHLQQGSQTGAAVVEFVLVSVLVTLAFLAVVQLAVALHIRNVLIDSAGAGARHAAVSGHTLADGQQRTSELVTADVSANYARDITVTRVDRDDLELIEVRIHAPIPVIGLWGPGADLTVTGHAIVEPS